MFLLHRCCPALFHNRSKCILTDKHLYTEENGWELFFICYFSYLLQLWTSPIFKCANIGQGLMKSRSEWCRTSATSTSQTRRASSTQRAEESWSRKRARAAREGTGHVSSMYRWALCSTVPQKEKFFWGTFSTLDNGQPIRWQSAVKRPKDISYFTFSFISIFFSSCTDYFRWIGLLGSRWIVL